MWTSQVYGHHDKMVNNMHVKYNIKNVLKMCGPKIRLCLFTFRPIVSKQLNSLTTNLTLSAEVTHMIWVREVPGSIHGSGKGFYALFFVWLLLLCLPFSSKSTSFVTKLCNFFCNF